MRGGRPVYQLRLWYEQFYVAAADIIEDMTARFEFEIDTTQANEAWQNEVAENLSARAESASMTGTESKAKAGMSCTSAPAPAA